MILLIVMVSAVSFFIIELPPGDYVTTYVNLLENQGIRVDEGQIASMRIMYGLDQPMPVRYFKWVSRLLRGDFGRSLYLNEKISTLMVQRIPFTIIISLTALIVTYLLAIPIGAYSAVNKYSIVDHLVTGLCYIGVAIPSFLTALMLMYINFRYFGFDTSGLFTQEYKLAAWSWAKFYDMLRHFPIPIIVISMGGMARLVRIMRNCLLDELQKQYVTTARSKGLKEFNLLMKYPIKVAMNPIVSTIGWQLPYIVSGSIIASIVLDLPLIGNLLYTSLLSQDTYLAGSIVLVLSALTVVGTFISDILLIFVDPRIRYR